VLVPATSPFTVQVAPLKETDTFALSADQTPPDGDEDMIVAVPVHTDALPASAAGSGLTVTDRVLKQPEPVIYDTSNEPAETPVTSPDAFASAIATLPLSHEPPEVALLSVMELPTHTDVGPVIAAGVSLIVMTLVVKQPVPKT
jgi:hypothetical protein